ncbi:hypothetical protein [Bradyrhizobium sp. BR 1432]|uniref:hypothetical protein n=1 Tax=Bradyrhizobium sp. BR 1432 TaxID=3447966 RepID=UPI003EE7CB02
MRHAPWVQSLARKLALILLPSPSSLQVLTLVELMATAAIPHITMQRYGVQVARKRSILLV